MSQRFSPAQLAALAYPFHGESAPSERCKWFSSKTEASGILTCDVDDGAVEGFGGPVWHASVCPPIRAYAETLLAGVGEGVLFDEPGIRPDIYHLRRRMTAAEIEQLGDSVQ
jgi:hypothetical protein